MTHNDLRNFINDATHNGHLTFKEVRLILRNNGYSVVGAIPISQLDKIKKEIERKIAFFDETEKEYEPENVFEPEETLYEFLQSYPTTTYRSNNGEGETIIYVIPASVICSVATFHVIESDLCGNVKLLKFKSARQLENDYGIKI